jgi:hypothetical protein
MQEDVLLYVVVEVVVITSKIHNHQKRQKEKR